jgi:hypothetical protein
MTEIYRTRDRQPVRSPYVYRYVEFPKRVIGRDGPVIVQDAEEERRIRFERARDIGRKRANAVQRARADAIAVELAPEIAASRARGSSFRDIADALNTRGILSARGCQWGPAQILRLLRRAESLTQKALRGRRVAWITATGLTVMAISDVDGGAPADLSAGGRRLSE